MTILAIRIDVPEYQAYDEAFRTYQALDVENNDVPREVIRQAIARIQETRAAWLAAAQRTIGDDGE